VPSGLLAFAVPYALGCGVISALGFYHITQPSAMRAAGDQRDRAVVWLTIVGAFASPIFLPLTAWLVHTLGWQGALRVHAALTLVIFTAAALASPRRAPAARRVTGNHARARDALAAAWRAPAFRRWIAASMIGGAAIDIILVNRARPDHRRRHPRDRPQLHAHPPAHHRRRGHHRHRHPTPPPRPVDLRVHALGRRCTTGGVVACA
jgi:MFS family permease